MPKNMRFYILQTKFFSKNFLRFFMFLACLLACMQDHACNDAWVNAPALGAPNTLILSLPDKTPSSPVFERAGIHDS